MRLYKVLLSSTLSISLFSILSWRRYLCSSFSFSSCRFAAARRCSSTYYLSSSTYDCSCSTLLLRTVSSLDSSSQSLTPKASSVSA
jgi:hypothetical protein